MNEDKIIKILNKNAPYRDISFIKKEEEYASEEGFYDVEEYGCYVSGIVGSSTKLQGISTSAIKELIEEAQKEILDKLELEFMDYSNRLTFQQQAQGYNNLFDLFKELEHTYNKDYTQK